MLSSAVNPTNGRDSTMPGGYEPFLGATARNPPLADSFGPSSSMAPPARTPFPQLSGARSTALPPTGGLPPRTPFPRLSVVPPAAGPMMGQSRMIPSSRPVRTHRHRRRRRPLLAPEIVVERRPHHHSSWGRHRVITVPINSRPTLGLRGSPSCVVEIERIPCRRRRRRRRHRSLCYDYDYDDPPLPPQPITIVANPIANPCLPSDAFSLMVPHNNTVAEATSALLSNLTPDTLNNLPKQTVHLEPIHLPGSHADANTKLHTVLFPAEMINPIDGTLSIIQANPAANGGGIVRIPSNLTPAVRPQAFNALATGGTPITLPRPPISPAMAADPMRQRFRELFQRLSIPQTQPVPNARINQPTLPNISEFNPANITVNNPPTIASSNVPIPRPYPSTNIQPANPLNTGSYRPANITPSQQANIAPYRTTTFTPSRLANNASYRPANTAPSNSSDMGPYRPANITPYSNLPNRTANNPLPQSSLASGPTPHASAGSLASTNTFTTFSSSPSPAARAANNSSGTPFPSLAPYSSNNSTPKSILRNGPSTSHSNTTYTRLSSPNVFASNNATPKTTRFT